MRSKEEILADTIKPGPESQKWDTTASTHTRLTIEVLIDIRDRLTAIEIDAGQLCKHIETWLPGPPKT